MKTQKQEIHLKTITINHKRIVFVGVCWFFSVGTYGRRNCTPSYSVRCSLTTSCSCNLSFVLPSSLQARYQRKQQIELTACNPLVQRWECAALFDVYRRKRLSARTLITFLSFAVFKICRKEKKRVEIFSYHPLILLVKTNNKKRSLLLSNEIKIIVRDGSYFKGLEKCAVSKSKIE